MQNVIKLIWRYNFTLLFLFIQFISFSLLISSNSFQKSSFINEANTFTGGVYTLLSDVSDYFKLSKENDRLAKENAKLKSQAVSAFTKLKAPLVYIKDTLYQQKYQYLDAKVVNSTIYKRNNYLIINQGSNQGIEPKMGVISSRGVVGIVKDVSENYALIMSLLHSKTKVSTKIKKNNFYGFLTWDGHDENIASLSDIPNHVNLSIGDTVVTRGSSTIYPAGIMVGVVADFSKKEGDDFYDLSIIISTQFRNLSYVYVVRNLHKEEQLSLEKLVEDDK